MNQKDYIYIDEYPCHWCSSGGIAFYYSIDSSNAIDYGNGWYFPVDKPTLIACRRCRTEYKWERIPNSASVCVMKSWWKRLIKKMYHPVSRK